MAPAKSTRRDRRAEKRVMRAESSSTVGTSGTVGPSNSHVSAPGRIRTTCKYSDALNASVTATPTASPSPSIGSSRVENLRSPATLAAYSPRSQTLILSPKVDVALSSRKDVASSETMPIMAPEVTSASNPQDQPSTSSSGRATGRSGDDNLTVFSVFIGDEVQPAIVLNTTFLSQVQDTKALIRDCEAAKAKLHEKEEYIESALRLAKVCLGRAKAHRDHARIESYRQPGGPNAQSKRKIIGLARKCREAVTAFEKVQQKKDRLEGAMREAQRRHYALLNRIQNTLLAGLEPVGLVQEQDEPMHEASKTLNSASSTSTSISPYTEGSEHGRHGEDYQAFRETPSSNGLDEMLEAIHHKHEKKKRVNKAHNALEKHRHTYHEQLHQHARHMHNWEKDIQTEFGPIYFQRTTNATRAVAEAEAALETAHQAAKQAGAPNADDQTSDFASVAGEGFRESVREEHIASVDPDRITKWLADIRTSPKRKTPVDRDGLAFPFAIAPINGVQDNPSNYIEPSPRLRTKMRSWQERCDTLRRKSRQKQNSNSKTRSSRSIHVVQAMPAPEDDPGFASERLPWVRLPSPDVDAKLSHPEVVVTHRHPDSWARASESKRRRTGRGHVYSQLTTVGNGVCFSNVSRTMMPRTPVNSVTME